MFYDQMTFHKREFEPNSLIFNLSWPSMAFQKPIAFFKKKTLGWKITKERHYDKNEYYVTNVFLCNKKVDKFLLDLCFGGSFKVTEVHHKCTSRIQFSSAGFAAFHEPRAAMAVPTNGSLCPIPWPKWRYFGSFWKTQHATTQAPWPPWIPCNHQLVTSKLWCPVLSQAWGCKAWVPSSACVCTITLSSAWFCTAGANGARRIHCRWWAGWFLWMLGVSFLASEEDGKGNYRQWDGPISVR